MIGMIGCGWFIGSGFAAGVHTPAISCVGILGSLASPLFVSHFGRRGVCSGRVCMSTWGGFLLPGLPWGRPGGQGLRARRNWPSPRASVLVPGPRLLPPPSPPPSQAGGRPRRGVRCCAERCDRPLATRFQLRPASPDRGHGVRLGDQGRRSEYAVLLGSAFRASRAL